MENLNWYQKPVFIILVCIVFFPVGLFLLWKSNKFNKLVKIGISAFFLIVVIVAPKGTNFKSHKSNSESSDNSNCCCEYQLVNKTCYEYVPTSYCEDVLKGEVHTVEWGKSNGIVHGSCK